MWVLVQSLTASEPYALMARERLNIQKQKLCWGRKGCFLGFVSSVFYLLLLLYFSLSQRKEVF